MNAAVLSRPFLRLTVANLLFFLNFASFFLLPLHVKALGGGEATVGAVMGTSGLASLSVLPAVGIALDRFGRRRFLLGGMAGMTLAAAGFLLVDRIGPALFALRLAQGISFAATFTAATTLAAELAPAAHRAQALGIFGISTLTTHAIAPAVGEEIVRWGGFPALFSVATACSTVALVLAGGLPRSPAAAHTWPAHVVPFRVDRLQWAAAGTVACCGMGFGAVLTFVPTFVRGEGLGRVGYFFTAYTATAILTRLLGGGLSDALGRRTVIVPTLLALAASIFALAMVHSVAALAMAGALFGSAQGLSYPTLNAFVVDLSHGAHLGRIQALFNGAFNLGVTASAFVFGSVAERFGHRPMFGLAAVMPLVACAIFSAATRDVAASRVPSS
jgi:MFS family permease